MAIIKGVRSWLCEACGAEGWNYPDQQQADEAADKHTCFPRSGTRIRTDDD